ncbi:hypothetical protein BTO30_05200 [Domibacillus antri]|uniref:DUF4912 domain-containing protein n=1 Tax=Domibacillus antri TaxID=1714264 RepID=A0A1Q8Q7T8_9BACI|nr:DUF4912 domain-containing protein [Domibacillus antri]OLN23361.1 hypothetical protein BTO30_05200 [Domibacillus antri]
MIEEIVQLKKRNFSWDQISDQLDLPLDNIKSKWRKYTRQQDGIRWQNDLNAVFLSADRLYCRWRIHPSILEAAVRCEKPLNPAIMDLRIFDITDIYYNGVNAHSVTCIKVSKDDQFWTIKGLKCNRSYICELGFLTEDYLFFPIVQSHPIHTPYQSSGDYIHRLREAKQFYHNPFRPPCWIEHPDCH